VLVGEPGRHSAGDQAIVGLGYDASGNMTSDPTDGVTATYDAENRIATATKNGVTTTYTYDTEGNPVEKSNAGFSTVYWYLTPGIVAESDLSGNLKSEYVFFDGERVARKDFPGNAVSYYFSDHLKTASVITDSAGNIKSELDYYPWGGELQLTNNDSNHYKFTGKERDTESGLDYFGSRYYSNGLSRFTSPDLPLIDQHPGDPQSWNLYTYVRNNPLRFTDPTGNSLQGCENVAICQEMEGNGTNNAAGTVSEAANQTPDPDELEEQAQRGDPVLDVMKGAGKEAGNEVRDLAVTVVQLGNLVGGGNSDNVIVAPGYKADNKTQDIAMKGTALILLFTPGAGEEVGTVKVVRTISKGEKVGALLNELKVLTHESGGLEHAIVTLKNGDRLIVSGSGAGINFGSMSSQLRRIMIHTHPSTTGASTADRKALQALGQRRSWLYEFFGGGLSKFWSWIGGK